MVMFLNVSKYRNNQRSKAVQEVMNFIGGFFCMDYRRIKLVQTFCSTVLVPGTHINIIIIFDLSSDLYIQGSCIVLQLFCSGEGGGGV